MADIGYNVHVTGDTNDLEVKLRGVGDTLDKTARRTISTAQATGKAAKAQRNEQGLLVDSMGRVIEGLSKWRQELGFYVDDTGRVLNAQGQLVDGLSTIQQKLGMYTDETGRIFNASGEITGLTAQGEKLKASQERVASDVRESWLGAFKGISDAGLKLNFVFSQLGNSSPALLAIGNAFSAGAASIHTTVEVANALNQSIGSLKKNFGGLSGLINATTGATGDLTKGLTNVTTAGKGLNALKTAFSALSGSIVPIAGIIAGVVGAIGAYIATVKQAQDVSAHTSDAFKKLEERAKSTGKAIQTLGDALAVDAMTEHKDAVTATVDAIEEAQKRLEQLQQARAKAFERMQEAPSFDGRSRGAWAESIDKYYGEQIAQAQGELRSNWASLSSEAEKLVTRATDALKTEAEKLQEERAQYQQLLDKWNEETAKAPEIATGETAKTAENLRAYMATLDKRITEAKEKEAEGSIDGARAEKLRAAGLDRILGAQEAVALNFQNYAERVKQWQKLAEEGTITQQELADAQRKTLEEITRDLRASTGVSVKDIQAEYVDAVKKWGEYLQVGGDQGVYDDAIKQLREQYRQRAGLTPDTSLIEKAQAEYAEKLNDIAFQLDQGIISEKEANTLRNAQLDALNDTIKAEKEKTLGGLGVNAIVESAQRLVDGEKTWQDEINEARQRLTDAVKQGAITEETANEARRRLADAWKIREKAESQESAKQERESIRTRFGVDNLMESLKSPLQRFQETMEELRANAGAFSLDELQALQIQTWQKFQDEMKTTSAGKYSETREEKKTAGSSLTTGSDALYKALVDRQAPTYQNNMQRNTAQIVTAQREGNDLAEQQVYYLAQMLSTLSSGRQFAVYGG